MKTFTDTLHLSPARIARVSGTYILTVETGKEPSAPVPRAFTTMAAFIALSVPNLEASTRRYVSRTTFEVVWGKGQVRQPWSVLLSGLRTDAQLVASAKEIR